MVIMTAKVPKRRLLLIVLLLIAAAVVLALCLRGAGGETEKPAKTGTQGATNEARIAFLESYGWQVEPEPVKTQQVTVPADPSEVFLRYNELQISQGYDLTQYSGKTLRRYVYTVTNYPAADGGPYYATVLVYKNEVAGGDVCSAAQNGVMHSFTMPS
mgnify:CR=1 FL=1